MFSHLSYVRRLSQLGTVLCARLFGTFAGKDAYGLRYYQMRFKDGTGRSARWVLYPGEPEASLIPPEGRAWLQFLREDPLPKRGANGYVWQRPHQPNLTGTDAAHLPPGHLLRRLRGFKLEDAGTRRKGRFWSPPDPQDPGR